MDLYGIRYAAPPLAGIGCAVPPLPPPPSSYPADLCLPPSSNWNRVEKLLRLTQKEKIMYRVSMLNQVACLGFRMECCGQRMLAHWPIYPVFRPIAFSCSIPHLGKCHHA